MHRITRRTLLLVLCMIVVAGSWIAFAIVQSHRTAAAKKAPVPVPVSVAKAVRRDVPITLEGLGTVQAFNTVTLKVRVDGALDAVLFTEGQNVKAGDLLARIDPRQYRASLDQALAKKGQDESQLPTAIRDLERFESLAKNNFAADQTLDRQRAVVAQLKAAVQADTAAVERARIDLGFTNITAPIDGRIGLRHVDVGNIVRAADQVGLAVISQVHPVAVIFTLPADDLPAITNAMRAGKSPVAIYRSDNTVKLADGELLTIDGAIDQATGTIRLKATSANLDDALWPGESVRAHLLIRTEQHALTVPESAVQRGPNGLFAYVVKPDSTVEAQPIDAIDVGGGTVVVTRGLNDEATVITNGQSRLRPGALVKVADPNGSKPPNGPRK